MKNIIQLILRSIFPFKKVSKPIKWERFNYKIKWSEIMKDWRNLFPLMTRYSENKLCVCCDIVVFQIFLKRNSYYKKYQPYIKIFPLWKDNQDNILKRDNEIFIKEIYDERNLQYAEGEYLHKKCFPTKKDMILKQWSFFNKDGVDVEKLLRYLFQETVDWHYFHIHQIWVILDIYEIALYVAKSLGNQDLLDSILKEMEKSFSEKYEPKYKKIDGTITPILKRKEKIYSALEHWDELMAIVERNKNLPKIQKLKSTYWINYQFNFDDILPKETKRNKFNILIKMLRGFMNQHLAHGIIQVGIFIQIPY